MASSIKGKVAYAGHAVAQAAKTAGHQIAEGNGKAVDFVKEKTGIEAPAGIQGFPSLSTSLFQLTHG